MHGCVPGLEMCVKSAAGVFRHLFAMPLSEAAIDIDQSLGGVYECEIKLSGATAGMLRLLMPTRTAARLATLWTGITVEPDETIASDAVREITELIAAGAGAKLDGCGEVWQTLACSQRWDDINDRATCVTDSGVFWIERRPVHLA